MEGQTEERFVKDILAPVLVADGVLVTASILGKPGHKGGRVNYQRVRNDIITHLKQDQGAYCSTLVDYYGLGKGFPEKNPTMTAEANARSAEQLLLTDICNEIPGFRPDRRLLPYIQVYEFEGLLFSDPRELANAIGMPGLAPDFQRIRDPVKTPEDINDGKETAPSKRLLTAYPRYSKVLHGASAAAAVGIDAILRECPRFRTWLESLKHLPPLS